MWVWLERYIYVIKICFRINLRTEEITAEAEGEVMAM